MVGKLVLLLCATVTNLALSLFILRKNPRMLVNRMFSLFAFLISLWVFSNFMAESTRDCGTALLWIRAAQAVSSLIGVSLLMFVSVFPLGRTLNIHTEMRVFLALALLFFALSWTPLVMQSVTREDWGVQDHPGPLLFLFAAYLVACIGLAMWKLYRKVTSTKGLEKLQIQYLVMGISLTAIVAVTTNLLLPLLTGASHLAGFGPSFSIILAAFVAHTIVRYRLLKIHLVIRRSVVYILSLGFAVIGFILLLEGLETFLRGPFGLDSRVSTSAAALAITVLFQPLKKGIQRLSDRYFYREARNYSTVVYNVSKALSSILDLERLIAYLREILTDLLHPDRVFIYLRSSPQGGFELQSSGEPAGSANGAPVLLPEDDILVSHLSAGRDLVILEELIRTRSDSSTDELIARMKGLGIGVAVPVVLKGELTAILLLGPLLSGDVYASDDLGFLLTLANQSAVAINNAQLYNEIRRVRDYNVNILARMESGVITVDGENTIVFCNRAAAGILLSDDSTLIGRDLADFDPTLAGLALDTLRHGVTCTNLETSLSRGGEESQPLVLSTSLLHGSNGEAEGAILVFNDISQLKAVEEERNQTERLAYVGSLAASLAHEIKNPLVTVKTMADLLLERYDDPEFRKEFVGLAVQEINRIDVLISQLLGFAREVPIVMQVLDITGPLEDMLLLLSHRLQENLIEVRRHFPTEPALVRADGGNLKQVFLNLLLNAVDATPERGLLDLTVESFRKRDREFVRVIVGNSGPPIPQEIRGKIFTPFFTTKPGGTGLGLSICQKIMQQHSGEICLEESRDDLTRFSITLPVFTADDVRARE